MNYKKAIFKEMATYVQEMDEDIKKKMPLIEEAYQLAVKFMENRYINELKQYNNVEEKVIDYFIAKKNLNLFHMYINEFYLLDKNIVDSNKQYYSTIKKRLNEINNMLWSTINNL